MEKTSIQQKTSQIIENLNHLISEYGANPDDSFADGNVAVCIISENGDVYGKIWGDKKSTGYRFAGLAFRKAIQVWATGYKTGEFERKIFNNELNEEDFGIQAPEFIGWDGGQPVTLADGEKLSIGFSGFRGFNDIEIVQKACTNL